MVFVSLLIDFKLKKNFYWDINNIGGIVIYNFVSLEELMQIEELNFLNITGY